MNKKINYKIVVIGGGTGLASLLGGLKHYTSNITAVVNVTDDGGSSGKLRKEFGVLPPGDIRSCLVALSEEENLMSRLFEYRFASKGPLSGHSFGNLLLTAMTAITGGFDNAISKCAEVLAIRGKVLPVTLDSAKLKAKLSDGSVVFGESKISESKKRIDLLSIVPNKVEPGLCNRFENRDGRDGGSFDAKIAENGSSIRKVFAEENVPYLRANSKSYCKIRVKVHKPVLDAISCADAIVSGPGSLYTSIISNYLVDGVTNAIKRSKAVKIYVANIMTQPGESTGYNISEHIEAIEKHSAENMFDYVLANKSIISKSVLKRYSKNSSIPLSPKIECGGSFKVVAADMLAQGRYIRHDSLKLAKNVIEIIQRSANA